jgi:hypothetical protein
MKEPRPVLSILLGTLSYWFPASTDSREQSAASPVATTKHSSSELSKISGSCAEVLDIVPVNAGGSISARLSSKPYESGLSSKPFESGLRRRAHNPSYFQSGAGSPAKAGRTVSGANS